MKFKFKNILMISFLAVAGIFGISSAVINNQVKETPVVEKAEAATTKRIYFLDDSNWSNYSWSRTSIWAWGTGGNNASNWDARPNMTQSGTHSYGGKNYYYYDIDYSKYQNCIITRNSDDARTGTIAVSSSSSEIVITLDSFKWKSDGECTTSWHTEYSDYYVIGSFNSWTCSDSYRLLRNFSNASDYGYMTNLSANVNDEFRVGYWTGGEISWESVKGIGNGSAYAAVEYINSGSNLKFLRRCVVDFYYISGEKVYVKGSNSGDLGYIYFGTNFDSNSGTAPENIYFWLTDGSGDHAIYGDAWPGVSLASMYATSSSSSLFFENRGGIYRLPVAALCGATKFVINKGGDTKKTGDMSLTAGNYYVLTGGGTDSNANTGAAAAVAMEFDSAIQGASNKSICNCTNASTLISLYDGLNSTAKSTLNDSSKNYIKTWNSTRPTYSGSQNAGFNAMRNELSKVSGAKSASLIYSSLSLFGGEDNFSTIIIIISSSVALLSVTALSILVIRKRKAKED